MTGRSIGLNVRIGNQTKWFTYMCLFSLCFYYLPFNSKKYEINSIGVLEENTFSEIHPTKESTQISERTDSRNTTKDELLSKKAGYFENVTQIQKANIQEVFSLICYTFIVL